MKTPEDRTPRTAHHEDPGPCWREMLSAAFAGLYPSDERLESMIDRLERTP